MMTATPEVGIVYPNVGHSDTRHFATGWGFVKAPPQKNRPAVEVRGRRILLLGFYYPLFCETFRLRVEHEAR